MHTVHNNIGSNGKEFLMLKQVVSAAFGLLLLFGAATGFCADLYEDAATGQLFTKPGDGRTLVSVPTEKMGTLYEDKDSGAVYTRPGGNRQPVGPASPMASAAGTKTPVETEQPAADYSTQAFTEAVRHVVSDDEATTYPKVKLGTLFYGEYLYDFNKQVLNADGSKGARNLFQLNRGYINLRAELTPEIKVRVTPDISRDSTGDYKLRLKFGYVDFHDFLAAYPSLEAKLGQFETAWLDYEEGLWQYRMQGTMLIEREGFINSADLGASFKGKLPQGFGDWQTDVINGEGYHKDETNKYKSVQARLTLTPLQFSPYTKGLNLTGWCELGRENLQRNMDRIIAFAGYKYEDDLFLGFEYDWTHGKDKFASASRGINNTKGAGYSAMAWYRMPFLAPLRVMGRYDHFNHNEDALASASTVNRYIYGASYDLGKSVTFLLDNEHTLAGSGINASEPNENLLKVDVQWKFN